MKWASQIVAWAATVLVARLLTPADYGLVAMATVFLGLVTMLSEFGFGAAIVTLRNLTEDHFAQLNAAAIGMGLLGFGVGCAAAWPLSRFFDAPDLVLVIVALSAGFVITGFQIVPQALLQRDLRFKQLAIIEGVQAVVLATSMVLLALAGLRYWTLVLGNLLSLLLYAAAVVSLRPQRMARPRFHEIAPALRFSWHILAQRVTWYLYNRADYLIVGRVLGQRALGSYSLAWSLASVPIEKITALVARVTPAYFAAVQDDPAALGRYLLRLTEGLALLTMPVTIGLALVTPDLVPLLFGEQWVAIVAPLQILALYATLRSVVTLLPQVLNVIGESRFAMINNVLALVVLPPAFYLGSRMGTVGIAVVWALVYPFVTVPLYWKVFRRLAMSPAAYARVLWPALSGCLLMAAAVLTARASLPDGSPLWLLVVTQVVVGAATYGATALILHRARVMPFLGMVRALRVRPA